MPTRKLNLPGAESIKKSLSDLSDRMSESKPLSATEHAELTVGRWHRRITPAAVAALSGHDVAALVEEVEWLVEAVASGSTEVDLASAEETEDDSEV